MRKEFQQQIQAEEFIENRISETRQQKTRQGQQNRVQIINSRAGFHAGRKFERLAQNFREKSSAFSSRKSETKIDDK